ncbi:MAG: hypothetical protein ACLPUG_03745 [Acidimicrobiales bacterium]
MAGLSTFTPSVPRRAKPGVVLVVALALSALVWEVSAAGAVASGPALKRPTATGVPAQNRVTAPAPRAGRLESAQAPANRGNNSRDGWYPQEPGLSPGVVGSSDFGEVFKTQLNGQIYAQPLLVGNILLVATETNWVYGLNPTTGAIEWSRQIGRPFKDAPVHCPDLIPYLGVTSTPAIDPTTGVAYLVDQVRLPGSAGIGWFMNAINPATGAEMPRFPVEIKGPASNNPQQAFRPLQELQRPGLLYTDGVVYAAFGSHCDHTPFAGFIAGVSTAGRQTTLWTDEAGPGSEGGGGGIWQASGGLSSDGPGQILFASGNAEGPETNHPIGSLPGHSPPLNLADSVVRLSVQKDGSLKATDFFAIHNDAKADEDDWDMSGSPVLLPTEFSTPKYRHLLVATGKEGIVYLLDADNLGGHNEGPGGRDDVVGEYGPNGQALSTAGVWPGDGGYVYVSTIQSASGHAGAVDVYKYTTTAGGVPGLRLVGYGSQAAVFGVSGPIVTSEGTASGSAVVWVIDGASLQAYEPVPVNRRLKLLGTWFVGNTDAFSPPGIGDNIVYVGVQDGYLYGFGPKPSSSAASDSRAAHA